MTSFCVRSACVCSVMMSLILVVTRWHQCVTPLNWILAGGKARKCISLRFFVRLWGSQRSIVIFKSEVVRLIPGINIFQDGVQMFFNDRPLFQYKVTWFIQWVKGTFETPTYPRSAHRHSSLISHCSHKYHTNPINSPRISQSPSIIWNAFVPV
jgi:hypothetical protein